MTTGPENAEHLANRRLGTIKVAEKIWTKDAGVLAIGKRQGIEVLCSEEIAVPKPALLKLPMRAFDRRHPVVDPCDKFQSPGEVGDQLPVPDRQLKHGASRALFHCGDRCPCEGGWRGRVPIRMGLGHRLRGRCGAVLQKRDLSFARSRHFELI